MAGLKTVRVEGAVTGTFHDGKNMIVLKEGKKALVAESSLSFLRGKGLIAENSLDHDNDGAAGGSTAADGAADELAAARERYKAATGKNFFPGWDAAELDRRAAEYQAKSADGAADDTADTGAPAA